METVHFGDVLKTFRTAQNLSLREASKKTGMSHSYIATLEGVNHKTGKPVKPSLETLEKLSDAYQIDSKKLLELYLSSTNGTVEEFDLGTKLEDLKREFDKIVNSNLACFYKGTQIKKTTLIISNKLDDLMREIDELAQIEESYVNNISPSDKDSI